ncbi:hypothetical protein DH2020_014454 [Rehmannia glutinosa]|uniref:Retrotransposon gag domain-containing protein n=1 Tax=Rehmannia glutinosa TaxID=99300 RepID=A0ABR0WZY4_REHGL
MGDRDNVINRLTELIQRQSKQIQQLIHQSDIAGEQRAEMNQPHQRADQIEIVGERFRKLNPPTFEDALDPTAAEDWLRTLDNMFQYRHWWDTMRSIEDVMTMTWERFKELFRNKYFTAHVRVLKTNEFIQLRHGAMTVGDYIRKFEELSRFATHMVSTDALKVERFLEGLRPELYRDNKRQIADQGKAPIALPFYPRCKTQHTGSCMVDNRRCFTCGMPGHFANAFPNRLNPTGQKNVPARAFTITRADAEANPSVVTSKLLIFDTPAFVLFDLGASHSFASTEYVRRLGRTPDVAEVGYNVTIPSGDSKQTNPILKACVIPIENRELYADLVVLAMNDYDIILGMDWFSKYGATIDCHKKTVTFRPQGENPFTFVGITTHFRFPIISALKAQCLLDVVCEGYLVSVMSIDETIPTNP